MDTTQDKYQPEINKWRDAVRQYGRGWDEDGPEIPVDYDLDVTMCDYIVGGQFKVFDGQRALLFSNPSLDLTCRLRKVKAHMNRVITAPEYAYEQIEAELRGQAVDVWQFLTGTVKRLRESHEGSRFECRLKTLITYAMHAHLTKIPSTQVWHLGCGYHEHVPDRNGATDCKHCGYRLWLRTTVFTTCPFVLFETNGNQSHTQRSHIEIELRSQTRPMFAAIVREINQRLIPVMSAMKIPDEVVQVLKSYAGPTFTEDGGVRVVKILRGIRAEIQPEGGRAWATVTVRSEDSHLAHDVKSTLSNDLE